MPVRPAAFSEQISMSKPTTIFSIICAVVAAVAICIQTIRLSRMASENEHLRAEMADLEDAFVSEIAENSRLRDLVQRSERALEATIKYLERAANERTKRMDSIDDSDPDWLQCRLPDGVRDAFSDYCDAGNQATGGPAATVSDAEG